MTLTGPREAGGVQGFTFNPTNTLIASGGTDSLLIWSLIDGGQLVKHYQIPKAGFSTVPNRSGEATGGIMQSYTYQNDQAEASIA